MSESELNPCPFCGGEAGIYDEPSVELNCVMHHAYCRSCDAHHGLDENRDKAAYVWNMRHTPSFGD